MSYLAATNGISVGLGSMATLLASPANVAPPAQAVVAWTPANSLASLFAWWDPQDPNNRTLGAGNTTYTALADKSGNSRNLSSLGSADPGFDNVNEPMDVVSVVSTSVLSTANLNLSQPFTLFQAVVRTGTNNTFQNGFSGGGVILWRPWHSSSPLIYAGTILTLPDLTNNVMSVIAASFSGGTGKYTQNDGTATTGAVNTSNVSAAPISLGNSPALDAPLQGAFGETIIVNSLINPGDDLYDRIIGYLSAKAVANAPSIVPSSFVYRYTAPLVGTQPTAATVTRNGQIIAHGATNSWNSTNIFDPRIIVDPTDSTKLMMYASGQTDPVGTGTASIGLYRASVSAPYTWTFDSVVFQAGSGTWDAGTGGVRLGDVYYDGTNIRLYYCSQSGNNAIGVALSTSLAGTSFTRPGSACLTPTGQGRNDGDNVGEPAIWFEGGTWTMIYDYRSGTTLLPGYRYATSSDGLTFTKGGSGDILTRPRRNIQLEAHHIVKRNGLYYLILEMGGPFAEGTHYRAYVAEANAVTGPYTLKKLLLAEAASGGDSVHVATPGLYTIGGTDYLFWTGTNQLTNPFYNAVWNMFAGSVSIPV